MPAPPDRVQLNKEESVAGGGDGADTDEFLHTLPLEPNEDAPEVQGVFFQRPAPSTLKDENVYVCRDSSDNLCLRDPNTNSGTEVTLNELATASVAFDSVLVDDVTGDTITDSCNLLVNA